MNWKELEHHLANNHFYFDRMIEIRKGGGETIVGLSQYCPSILKQMRLDKINEVLPDEYSVAYLPGVEEIQIRRIND